MNRDDLPSPQRIRLEQHLILSQRKQRFPAILTSAIRLPRRLFLCRKRERRRVAIAVVAFSIGGVERETVFAMRVKVVDAGLDQLSVALEMSHEGFGSLQACGDL
jgi:hypothetical protein